MSSDARSRSILVVDDAPESLEVIRRYLEPQGFRILTASNVPGALAILEDTSVDLVLTDYKMPQIDGLDLVRHVRENLRDTEVIMVTGYATVQGAIQAIKTGAEEYLSKPFTEEELLAAVREALEKRERKRAAGRDARIPEAESMPGLIGESPAMQVVYRMIRKAARTAATVLITGESGTGKELVARAIHYHSDRASHPFVPVNCGAIPEGLIESELFGHVRGAFTGASVSRAGHFLTADKGTIFLDEISELGLSMQVKLLRVLQDREVLMVGTSHPRRVDVRVLSATNKDLLTLVHRGTFREDLYFRLNVLNIHVPPLRQRENDILYLARHFAEKYAKELGMDTPEISDTLLDTFRSYHWAGNVRELENVVQRLIVMAEGSRIDLPDLPSVMRFSLPRGAGLHRTLAEVEIDHIRAVLASVDGNKTRAARILGIDRKTLREKLKATASAVPVERNTPVA